MSWKLAEVARLRPRVGVVALALALTMAGCDAAPSDEPAPPQQAPGPAGEARTRIAPGPLQPYGYSVVDSAAFDVTGDGVPERIELLANIERDARGQLLWDDGHHWVVLVRQDSLAYPLIERFIPWGYAEFAAIREHPGDRPVVLVQAYARLGCGGGEGNIGISVEKFAFDASDRTFVREAVVESAGWGVCATVQGR